MSSAHQAQGLLTVFYLDYNSRPIFPSPPKCKGYCSGISELSVRDYLEILTFRDGGLSACQGWNP